MIQSGSQFGRLTVLGNFQIDDRRRRKWECRCICGTVKFIHTEHLRSGRTVSCGCKRRENKGGPQSDKWAKLSTLPVIRGGRSLQEIAEHIGLSHQVVSMVEHKALAKMRAHLLELGISRDDLFLFLTKERKSNAKETASTNYSG